MNKFSFVILLSIISLTSCDKTQNSECDVSGDSYFCAKIDDKLYQCIKYYATKDTGSIGGSESGYKLHTLLGEKKILTRTESILILFEHFEIGTHIEKVSATADLNEGQFKNKYKDGLPPNTAFTLIINEIDSINLIISGEFYGDLVDTIQNTSVQVSNGQFKCNYENSGWEIDN
jgi:hypothetical protein